MWNGFPARWPQESHLAGQEVASNTSGTIDVSSGHTLPQQLSNSNIQGSAAIGFSQTPDQVDAADQCGVFCTAAASEDMRTMALAAQSNNSSAAITKAMTEAVEQVKFDQLRLKLESEGIDLSAHCSFPNQHPVTGKPLYAFEDEPHKLKNAMQGIQRQVIQSTVARPHCCNQGAQAAVRPAVFWDQLDAKAAAAL